MCGRYTLLDLSEFIQMFPWVAPPEVFAPRFNIAPGQPILAITNRGGGGALEHLIWGMIPAWAKADQPRRALVNVRCESLEQKPTFRSALRYRRCIVPASGFYEWRKTIPGNQPFYIQREDRKPMLLAGLWEDAHDGAGGEFATAGIITTPSNRAVAELHDRMPAILEADEARRWISADSTEAPSLLPLLRPYPGRLDLTPVSRTVNSQANDSPACIEPEQMRDSLF